MTDFIELMDFCAFDVDKAAALAGGARPLREIIDEILEEAGLDAVARIQPKPGQHQDRRLHNPGDLRGYRA